MKLRNIFQILILLLSIAFISGCSKQVNEFTLTQDGNFLVYQGDSLTFNDKFEEGSRLIVKIKEDKVPQNSMINEVLINGVAQQLMYQYTIVMDRNINLQATFKEIPVGLARVSFVGEFVELLPAATDNVYKIGTKITLKAPKHFRFSHFYINGEKIQVDETSYEFEITGETKINVEKSSLIKTHNQITIVHPEGLEVKVENATSDNYYPIGSQITLLAPENYGFVGLIYINGEVTPISGTRLVITITSQTTIAFNSENIALNTYKVELGEGLEIEGPPQALYAYGSIITVKANNSDGFDVINTITINKQTYDVNGPTYEVEIKGDTEISATFDKFHGPYIEQDISTGQLIELPKEAKVYSPSLNINMFLLSDDTNKYLAFQKAGTYLVRIDIGKTTEFYEYDVKYDIETVKVHQNGFGFIYKEDVMKVGYYNDFSLSLEVVAIIPNLEIVGSFYKTAFVVLSNEVSNISYTLEEKGKDVTDLYLELDEGIKFKPEAVSKVFDLIIEAEGLEIIQPIEILEGINVRKADEITEGTLNILQADILIEERLYIEELIEIIGNYHTILSNSEDEYIIYADEGSRVSLSDVIIKGKPHNESLIRVNKAELVLNNTVLESAQAGIIGDDATLNINLTKFQHLEKTNLLILVEKPSVNLDISIIKSVFSKTEYASIYIVDFNDQLTLSKELFVSIEDNVFKNIKPLDSLEEEIVLGLIQFDSTLVNELENEANFSVYLSDGLEIVQVDDQE